MYLICIMYLICNILVLTAEKLYILYSSVDTCTKILSSETLNIFYLGIGKIFAQKNNDQILNQCIFQRKANYSMRIKPGFSH